ncbi:rhamnan synthesis F family protein [Rhodanobacter denitrificans]|uniref:rhamnan synthesis F family protein n=1 Tax=Rhodanobacter denitrificans TaxID=666685 RepID=UPI001F2681DB|nr:rhamnan synthesis F family protein [Rhodanobacter denitrificans]UJJ59572.1 glycosyltransferase [Rhodanobacter denitrificans]
MSTRRKLLYVATPKVACTSLKWWFAALEGYAQVLRGSNGSLETDPDLVIHDTFHKVAPNVTGLLPDALAEALASEDYFRFAVVRNPYKRIFSAWQSKILLREPLQIGAYLGHDFVHHPIKNPGDISIAFERFLEYLAGNEPSVFWDLHWTPQVEILRPELINYSILAKIEDTAPLSQALLAWLGPGIQGPFGAKRSNESLIPYLPELISVRSCQLIRSIYARDFEVFGYGADKPSSTVKFSAAQFDVSVHAINMLRGKNQRLAEIQTAQKSQLSILDGTLIEKEAKIAALSQELAGREAAMGSLNEEARGRDEMIARVNLLLVDRDKTLAELGHAVKDGGIQVGTLTSMLAESKDEFRQFKADRDAQVAMLEGGLLDRDTALSKLGEALAERIKQQESLSQTLKEHDEELNQFKADRDARVTMLEEMLLDRDARIGELSEALAERIRQQDDLGRTLKERDGELNQFKADRDAQVAMLEGALVDRDARIGELSETLAERIRQQDDLGRTLKERADELNQFKADRDAQVAMLEGALVDRDAKIGELSETLAARVEQSDGIASNLAIKTRELDEFRQLLDDSRAELRKVSMIKEELEDMNSRMRGTAVWRLASKLSLVRTPSVGQDGFRAAGTKVPKGFDASWYLKEYPDVAASGMDPYEHYVLAGKSEGRRPAPVPRSRLKKLRVLRSGLLAAVRQAGGVRKAVEKVTTVAKRDGWFVPDFDEAFYLEMYPDIREAGMDPYEHFVQHGRAEGRIGRSPDLKLQKGAVRLDAARKTVLVVSHEASRTGAPILSLNIARELQKRFNVIALVLGDGPMMAAFREVVPVVVEPVSVRGNVGMASNVITQLAQSYEFDFAIVNSIESRFVLKELAKLSIPAISLIHEFAAYTRPIDAFRFAILWAAETVFSARITHENAIAAFPELAGQPFHIMPQGRCSMLAHAVDPESQAVERSRLLRTLRPGGEVDKDTVVVVGIGYVQYRKGVDLFLKCAAKVIRSKGGERCRFVWIGKGYDPVNDMAYSAYLAEQLQRSGLQEQFTFMGETAFIEQVYESADILVLSSRLDPLPNVAIDAMAHGLPVVCFANTTGVVDALVDSGLSKECVAPYLDSGAMAELVLNFARSNDLRNRVGMRLQQTVRDQFDMERYVAELEGLAKSAKRRLTNEIESAKDILDSALLRPDFFLSTTDKYASDDEMVRYGYVRSWAAGISKRKAFPGFHPGIYLDQHGVEDLGVDPLASYLRAGLPEGPWQFEVISSEDALVKMPAGVRVALHLHVYYPDLLGEILERLNLNAVRPDLFISVPSEQVASVVRETVRKYPKNLVKVEVVPNVGRDLGPFLTAFGDTFVDHYDIVGHLHTKKSVDIADEATGKIWYAFLMENLLGGKARMADLILGRMGGDPSIGMVFPDDPHIVGWGANRPYAEKLGTRLGMENFPENLVFPVGSMFWARTKAIRPFFDLGLAWQDYPAEPLPYDGSMLHAIERTLPLVAAKQSTRVALTNVVGVTR